MCSCSATIRHHLTQVVCLHRAAGESPKFSYPHLYTTVTESTRNRTVNMEEIVGGAGRCGEDAWGTKQAK
jgi:hypothetical protein